MDKHRATSVAARAEQVRAIYRQPLGILIVNPINAAILALVLWPSRQHLLLLGWVLATALVAGIRVNLRSRYLRVTTGIEETDAWARRFVAGTMLAGLLWGLGGATFYDARAPLASMLLIFVIGGMVAGASGTLALQLPAFVAFAAPAILPTSIRIFLEGDSVHAAMAILAAIFGVAMFLVAVNNNRAVTEAFRLRFENQSLLEMLSEAQVTLAETNRTLEQRVQERGAALERQTEALRDAQRMESIGLLAGGVAHDFNNLLTVVLGNLELLLQTDHLREQDRRTLEVIRGAANRAAVLVSQLLAFSRRQVMDRRVLDLNGVISEVHPLLSRLIGAHIELIVSAHPEALPVRADPTQLHQVVINLATNARDAMPNGGSLRIETAVEEIPSEIESVPPGRYAVLSVRDTGVGMDAETQQMIFHPFFTTKEIGRGTGLGLSTVHGIIEQSEGHVFVESEPGRGSCFRVLLPYVAGTIESAAPPVETIAPATSQPTFASSATILVAEDEEAVRALTVQILSDAGFEVIEAGDGEQALQISRSTSGPIDLLISDVLMPKMGGIDLANHMASERPGIRILLVSGYSADQTIPAGDSSPGTGFLQKPFTPNDLLQKVSKLLANTTLKHYAT